MVFQPKHSLSSLLFEVEAFNFLSKGKNRRLENVKAKDEGWDVQNKGLEVAEIRNVQGFLAWEATPASQALSFQGVSRGNHPSILGHTL